jgi:hypothetical protein
MPVRPKRSRAKTASERMRARRVRLRAAGLRPVQHWVPDLRNPKILAQIRREAEMLDKRPKNDVLDAWLDAVLADIEWS